LDKLEEYDLDVVIPEVFVVRLKIRVTPVGPSSDDVG